MSEPENTRVGDLILYCSANCPVTVGVDVRTISEHLQNIDEFGELTQQATLRKFRKVQREGNRDVADKIDNA